MGQNEVKRPPSQTKQSAESQKDGYAGQIVSLLQITHLALRSSSAR